MNPSESKLLKRFKTDMACCTSWTGTSEQREILVSLSVKCLFVPALVLLLGHIWFTGS